MASQLFVECNEDKCPVHVANGIAVTANRSALRKEERARTDGLFAISLARHVVSNELPSLAALHSHAVGNFDAPDFAHVLAPHRPTGPVGTLRHCHNVAVVN